MKNRKCTCPVCGHQFMVPVYQKDGPIRVSLDGDMHNGSAYDLFALCPKCGYIFPRDNPVAIDEISEVCKTTEYQETHADDPLLNTLYHAGYAFIASQHFDSAAECYLYAGWYAREHHMAQEQKNSFTAAVNCYIAQLAAAKKADDSLFNGYLTVIDLLRQLDNFNGAKQLVMQFEDYLAQNFQQCIEKEPTEKTQKEVGWIIWFTCVAEFENDLIQAKDHTVHFFDEREGLAE